MVNATRLSLALLAALSVTAFAAPPPPSPCEVVGEVAALIDLHAADPVTAIAPALVVELQTKYSAECAPPAADSGITRCRMGYDDKAIEFLVYDQSRHFNGIAMALVQVKPVSERVNLLQCFQSEPFKGWRKNETRRPCGPSIWKLTGTGQEMLFVEPQPMPACEVASNNVIVGMAKGTWPRPVVH